MTFAAGTKTQSGNAGSGKQTAQQSQQSQQKPASKGKSKAAASPGKVGKDVERKFIFPYLDGSFSIGTPTTPPLPPPRETLVSTQGATCHVTPTREEVSTGAQSS